MSDSKKVSYTLQRKRKLKNKLEESFIIELSNTVAYFDECSGDPSDFRNRVDHLVKEYSKKTTAFNSSKNKCIFQLSTYWPLTGNGRFMNCGSLIRTNDATGSPIISLSWIESK